jgi:hypothetical protein
MPKPDYTSFVINTKSAGVKSSESWVISRLIRDLQEEIEERHQKDSPLMITFYQASQAFPLATTLH